MSEEHMSDDNIINYTQGLRRRLAEEMTKDKLPDDPKDRQILHQLWQGQPKVPFFCLV